MIWRSLVMCLGFYCVLAYEPQAASAPPSVAERATLDALFEQSVKTTGFGKTTDAVGALQLQGTF